MMKKKDVLGIELNYDYVRDIYPVVEEYLQDVVMNTIYIVSLTALMETEQNQEFKDLIAQMDLTLIGEPEILKAAGLSDRLLENEIKGQIFLKQLFLRALQENKSFFLLARTEEEIKEMQQTLENKYGEIMITNTYAKEKCIGDTDLIVNEINITSPDILLVKLPTPEMEKFMIEGKEKISTKLCIGFRTEIYNRMHKRSFSEWLRRQIRKNTFYRLVTRYRNREIISG